MILVVWYLLVSGAQVAFAVDETACFDPFSNLLSVDVHCAGEGGLVAVAVLADIGF